MISQYYILQVLVDRNKNARRNCVAKAQFYLFSRWGRTGTGGQAKLGGPFLNEETAQESFADTFKAKTGVNWSEAFSGAAPKKGKYEYLNTSTNKQSGDINWYYFLINDPLGKSDAWYAYDERNRAETEELYSEFVASNNAARLSNRLVHSDSSGFTYKIDLQNMTQMNTKSLTVRTIHRTNNGKEPQNKPSVFFGTPNTPLSSVTPHKVLSAKSPAKKSTPLAARSLTKPLSALAATVDSAASITLQGGSVYGEFDAMLNQTNLSANNNKFYKIQLVEASDGVYMFTKWGRVGEAGAIQEAGPFESDVAEKEFCKKFKNKTSNIWEDRENFETMTGKYALVEMKKYAVASVASPGINILPSKLNSKTKGFVDLIFDEDMFKTAMSAMNLDPVKLPLGAVSKAQIKRGFDALESLEEEINDKANPRNLMELTSDFYTIIPHSFGRSQGPVLNSTDMVKEKYDMLNTLTDIEAAQGMRNMHKAGASEETHDHPSDVNYKQLAANLILVEEDDEYRPIIERYLNDTKGVGYTSNMQLRDIWRVSRHEESKRFASHAEISNRKLLWHGTNVAVVAAILKNGLRIMPHSRGRVGSGIYLADQHEKSAWYVSPAQNTIIMFLVEAALGKQFEINQDDSSLMSAPQGYDSVLAKGSKAPHLEAELTIDGKSVKVPHGKPKAVKTAKGSSFSHNEFLIYKESQHRIRYVLAFDQN